MAKNGFEVLKEQRRQELNLINQTDVSRAIRGTYKNWRPGDIVLISAPTGSGKSTFIRSTLLDPMRDVITKNQPVLYFVNRVALKQQLENDIYNDLRYGKQFGSSFFISTYQQLESFLINRGRKAKEALATELQKFYYVVFDECHYFLSDSVYNTETCVSYDFLNSVFDNKIRIFMSATCTRIQKMLFEKYCDSSYSTPIKYDSEDDLLGRRRFANNRGYYGYSLPADYDYITLHPFSCGNSITNSIFEIIKRRYDGSKWLIFVDSLQNGEKLRDKLEKDKTIGEGRREEISIDFISADYRHNEYESEKVSCMMRYKKTISKITICTSVFDSGISFLDDELENIVILADDCEDFIQMLGRKRINKSDNKRERVNLFFCIQNSKHFQDRLNDVDQTLGVYNRYRNLILRASKEKSIRARQIVLGDLLKQETVRKHFSRFCYVESGKLLINPFSINQLKYRHDFYKFMIEALKTNPCAFLFKQAIWLGFSGKAFNDSLVDGIKAVLKPYLAVERFNSEDNIRLKKELKDYVFPLLCLNQVENWKSTLDNLGKSTTPLSCKRFNSIMSYPLIHLPFRMKQKQNRDQMQASEKGTWYSIYINES